MESKVWREGGWDMAMYIVDDVMSFMILSAGYILETKFQNQHETIKFGKIITNVPF